MIRKMPKIAKMALIAIPISARIGDMLGHLNRAKVSAVGIAMPAMPHPAATSSFIPVDYDVSIKRPNISRIAANRIMARLLASKRS